ncbi:SapC family protein [Sphingomonas sp.]|uniref:SapC family protein n=1 Tax=Sphingomonas sp. TaxID=28214 RepID=UPI003B3BBA1E
MNRVLINNIDHADLKVAIGVGASYGDSVNQMLIFPSEFEEAQRHFPIVFRQSEDGMQALVLLGLDRDENLFLENDRWTSAYVPASQRRGPFSMAMTRPQSDGEAPGEPMIHVDLDDPRVGVEDGFPLFLQHGGNAPYLDHIASVLGVIYDGLTGAPQVYAALEEAGLLQPVTMNIQINEEKGYDLPDLFVIDQQALANLSGERLEALHRSGLLRAAIMAAASLGNVARLIDLKNKRAGA